MARGIVGSVQAPRCSCQRPCRPCALAAGLLLALLAAQGALFVTLWAPCSQPTGSTGTGCILVLELCPLCFRNRPHERKMASSSSRAAEWLESWRQPAAGSQESSGQRSTAGEGDLFYLFSSCFARWAPMAAPAMPQSPPAPRRAAMLIASWLIAIGCRRRFQASKQNNKQEQKKPNAQKNTSLVEKAEREGAGAEC